MRSPLAYVAYVAMCVAGLGSAGCGPSSKDVARLRDEGDDGPSRLAAIVRDGKGSHAVQQEAALALVTLTRRDRRVGLDLLANALATRSADARAPLVEGLTAELTKGMTLPRTPAVGRAPDDPALAYENGAYLLFSRDLAAGAAKKALASALQRWLEESPMDRLDDVRHRFGLTSLVHALGPAAAKALLRFFDDHLDYRSALGIVLAEGDEETKRAASVALAKLTTTIRTPAWREAQRPSVEASHRASGASGTALTTLQLDAQLRASQSYALEDVFRALEPLAYPAAVSTLIGAGEDRELKSSVRVVALKTLAKRAGSLDDAELDRILKLATPPQDDADIGRAALACAAKAPAARPKLLALVASPSTWRTRMEAALALLREGSPSAIEDVLKRLPARADVPMALAELTAYGAALALTEEGKAAARAHLGDASLGARLAALTTLRDDRAALAPHEKDDARLPRCSASDPCAWTCGDSVTTVGQYVHACLLTPPAWNRGGYDVPHPSLGPDADAMQMQMLAALGAGSALSALTDAGADSGADAGAPPPKKK